MDKEDIDDLAKILDKTDSGMISTLKNLKDSFDFINYTLVYRSRR